jgi:hypothetical protein
VPKPSLRDTLLTSASLILFGVVQLTMTSWGLLRGERRRWSGSGMPSPSLASSSSPFPA